MSLDDLSSVLLWPEISRLSNTREILPDRINLLASLPLLFGMGSAVKEVESWRSEMLHLKTMLVPVDFSERSLAAAEHAAVIAKRFESHLIFLHVIPRPDPSAAVLEVGRGAPSPDEEEAVRKRMKLLERKVSDQPMETIVRWGDPAKCIEKTVWQRDADLVMMPTHGYGPFRRFLLGSVTAKVLHDVSCPVFSGTHVPEVEVFGPVPYKHVACAIDLNGFSVTVLRWAWQFAEAWGADLHVIHAAKCLEQDWTQAELMHNEKQNISELINAVGCEARIHMDVGSVIDFVPAVAKRSEADVLVIGRSAGEEWNGRLRSEAYTLIRESPCAVVSV